MLKMSHETRMHLTRHELNACFDWTASAVSLQRNLHTFRIHPSENFISDFPQGWRHSLKKAVMSVMDEM